jgi:hypothetical protein
MALATTIFVNPGTFLKYYGGEKDSFRIRFFSLFLSGLVVALIGGFAGQLGGSSREGVLGDLLPALMVLLGGYATYLVGQREVRSVRLIHNGLCFVFSFFLLYNVSSVWRQSNEAFEFCKSVYSNPDYAKPDVSGDRNALWGNYCQPVFAKWTIVNKP